MMFLIDTNLFLEILLAQEKREVCKKFLELNSGRLYITDSSLHSIGVILFKNDKEEIFQKFADDIVSDIEIVTLRKELYSSLKETKVALGLDFDDIYQYRIAKADKLQLVTMDRDSETVKEEVGVVFL